MHPEYNYPTCTWERDGDKLADCKVTYKDPYANDENHDEMACDDYCSVNSGRIEIKED